MNEKKREGTVMTIYYPSIESKQGGNKNGKRRGTHGETSEHVG